MSGDKDFKDLFEKASQAINAKNISQDDNTKILNEEVVPLFSE